MCSFASIDGRAAASARQRPWLDRGGIASLEFALGGALLMSLVLGAIEIGRYVFTVEALRTAAAEAARLVTIRGSANMIAGNAPCTGLSGSLTGAGLNASYLATNNLSITMSSCATSGSVTTVTVTATYPFSFAVSALGHGRTSISESIQAVFN